MAVVRRAPSAKPLVLIIVRYRPAHKTKAPSLSRKFLLVFACRNFGVSCEGLKVMVPQRFVESSIGVANTTPACNPLLNHQPLQRVLSRITIQK